MPRKKGNPSARFRVGKVTVYEHHGAWWVYYRDAGQTHSRKVAETRSEAETVAAQVNAQLAEQEPTLLTFTPVAELRRQFLDYHEKVLHSAVGTVRRYRAATQHLEDFAARESGSLQAHQVKPEAFAAYLRTIEVAPNGHRNAGKRHLRDKGIRFILETCGGTPEWSRRSWVRTSFVRVMKATGHPEATCPKSWWHTFATLLQDGNVDPLIRQQVMGRRPTVSSGLGMTAKYTHTRPETLRTQVEAALRQWPEVLRFAAERTAG